MRRLTYFSALLLVLVGGAGFAQRATPARAIPANEPAVDVSAALNTVVPDLDARLARFKPVRMPYNASALTARERR
jgi:hypothetical protein